MTTAHVNPPLRTIARSISPSATAVVRRRGQTSPAEDERTVRAFALAKQMSHEDARDLLRASGRAACTGFHLQKWLKFQPWAHKLSLLVVKGEPRMNCASFSRSFPRGRFLCRTSTHVFAVINGTVFDDAQTPPNQCIFAAWESKE